jgi:signal transduction histidine kinase
VLFSGRVDWHVEPGAERLVADPDRLRTALTNLLVNALEAMAETAREDHRLEVRVEACAEDGGFAISISDTGPGVPPELRERIFYPFFTTRDHGSGVGLAEAQKVVAGHGGVIEVDGRPGGGATFRIHLPAAEAP